ncbi:YceI family protein [Luteolibacter sp. GHJ8]|uniref:YceI family protein n=1 Tax=Luteolibacter rhizosphaerae TaxID=2989719 RepID=A0ABT3G8Q0_9BACT|nr:YceI family protein [Luteolibacter rhizosphaerae]MCW1915575.1 YceI family protein [Luteolibacter rhizosphaerae]
MSGPLFLVVDARELSDRLSSTAPPVLVDVRLDTDCECSRIPGAVNNCVFEVAFLDRMAEIAPDRARPVCVYGADDGSLESRMAAEKLSRAGWSDVLDFREGLSGWRAAGYEVEERSAQAAHPPIPSGSHALDLNESRVLWTGRNLLNRHDGSIPIKSGELKIEAGRLVGGEFTLDMRGITCTDLNGDKLHDVLIDHLHSDDFFDVEFYPEARFVITQASPQNGASPGSPNLKVAGELTLKGITQPVEFAACAGVTSEGKLAAQASFSIDRTRWNVFYGSGKFFRNLGGHLVNDLIDLNLRIVAE